MHMHEPHRARVSGNRNNNKNNNKKVIKIKKRNETN